MIYLVTKEGLSPGGLEFENSIVSVYRMRVFWGQPGGPRTLAGFIFDWVNFMATSHNRNPQIIYVVSKRNPLLISGKSRLVKYYNLPNLGDSVLCFTFSLQSDLLNTCLLPTSYLPVPHKLHHSSIWGKVQQGIACRTCGGCAKESRSMVRVPLSVLPR